MFGNAVQSRSQLATFENARTRPSCRLVAAWAVTIAVPIRAGLPTRGRTPRTRASRWHPAFRPQSQRGERRQSPRRTRGIRAERTWAWRRESITTHQSSCETYRIIVKGPQQSLAAGFRLSRRWRGDHRVRRHWIRVATTCRECAGHHHWCSHRRARRRMSPLVRPSQIEVDYA